MTSTADRKSEIRADLFNTRIDGAVATVREWQRGAITWRQMRFQLGGTLTAERLDRLCRTIHATISRSQLRDAIAAALAGDGQ